MIEERARIALVEQLDERRSALSRRCIEAMYRDPFWQARFGDRGRRHAEEDSAYHVQYASSALRADDVEIFRNYARWLRGVLAARGMCSWHLAESFRQLAIAIRDEAIVGADAAVAILVDGERCLAYAEGEAARFDARRTAIVRRAEEQPRSYRATELASFVADALARGDGDVLAAHVAFLRGTLARGEERAALESTLRALVEATEAELGGSSASLIGALLTVSPDPGETARG
jgi:hypothetical protein